MQVVWSAPTTSSRVEPCCPLVGAVVTRYPLMPEIQIYQYAAISCCMDYIRPQYKQLKQTPHFLSVFATLSPASKRFLCQAPWNELPRRQPCHSQHNFNSLWDITKLKISWHVKKRWIYSLWVGVSKAFNPCFTEVSCAAPISYCGTKVHPKHFQKSHEYKLILHCQKSFWSNSAFPPLDFF